MKIINVKTQNADIGLLLFSLSACLLNVLNVPIDNHR